MSAQRLRSLRTGALLLLAGILSAAAGGRHADAQDAGDREYGIKAECLHRFIEFVEWPARAMPENSQIVVGVLGQNPFGSALNRIQGRSVKGRTITVRQVSALRDAHNCHVLFVSPSEKDRTRQILDALQNESVLTVSETTGFARDGGIINFISRANKLRFEINPQAASRARLTISSQLLNLKLATIVKN